METNNAGLRALTMSYTGDWEKDHYALSLEIVASIKTPHLNEQRALIAKARAVYSNPRYGKRLTDTNEGRDLLHIFMDHWMDCIIQTGSLKPYLVKEVA